MKEIPKKELLDKIDQAIRVEEVAIQVYIRDIVSVLPLSGLSEEKQDQFKGAMEMIVKDSRDHKRRLEDVREKVTKGVR